MEKVCSVTITATVHDAVHTIQDELMGSSEQVGLKRTFFGYLHLLKNNLVVIM
jgi:hypothetical protein